MNNPFGCALLALSLTFLAGCPSKGSQNQSPSEPTEGANRLIETPEQSVESTENAESHSTVLPDGIIHLEDRWGRESRLSADFHGAQHSALRHAHQVFALSEYRRQSGDDDNVTTSVLDKHMLLGMASIGAAGTTLDALQKASGLEVDGALPFLQINAWDQHLTGLSGVIAARHFWGQSYYRFSKDYLENIAKYFGPEMKALEFRDAAFESYRQVNETLLDPLQLNSDGGSTRVVMAQSFSVEQSWSDVLSQSSFKGRFALAEGQRYVDMLRLEGFINVVETDQLKAYEIPLATPELTLMVLEPKGLISNLKTVFDQAMLQRILEGFVPQQATVNLPIFNVENAFQGDELADLGPAAVMRDDDLPFLVMPFSTVESAIQEPVSEIEEVSDDEANFYPVNGAGYLYLSKIKQTVAMALTTQGLSAKMAGALVHSAKGDEPGELIDQSDWDAAGVSITTTNNETPCYYPAHQSPFIYALYAPTSGTVLAVGHVVDVPGEKVPADWYDNSLQGCGESPNVQIFKSTGALQCESDGVDLDSMKAQLQAIGIEVLALGSGTDGLYYPAVCGAATGDIHHFTIHYDDLQLAEDNGFYPMSDLVNPIW